MATGDLANNLATALAAARRARLPPADAAGLAAGAPGAVLPLLAAALRVGGVRPPAASDAGALLRALRAARPEGLGVGAPARALTPAALAAPGAAERKLILLAAAAAAAGEAAARRAKRRGAARGAAHGGPAVAGGRPPPGRPAQPLASRDANVGAVLAVAAALAAPSPPPPAARTRPPPPPHRAADRLAAAEAAAACAAALVVALDGRVAALEREGCGGEGVAADRAADQPAPAADLPSPSPFWAAVGAIDTPPSRDSPRVAAAGPQPPARPPPPRAGAPAASVDAFAAAVGARLTAARAHLAALDGRECE
jgi:hypothetical protein